MQTITINVQGAELETITVELTDEEVRGIYQLRKEQAAKIIELEKTIKSNESTKAHTDRRLDEATSELQHAHILMTALNVQEKTSEEEAYYRKALPIATRIALFIAKKQP